MLLLQSYLQLYRVVIGTGKALVQSLAGLIRLQRYVNNGSRGQCLERIRIRLPASSPPACVISLLKRSDISSSQAELPRRIRISSQQGRAPAAGRAAPKSRKTCS